MGNKNSRVNNLPSYDDIIQDSPPSYNEIKKMDEAKKYFYNLTKEKFLIIEKDYSEYERFGIDVMFRKRVSRYSSAGYFELMLRYLHPRMKMTTSDLYDAIHKLHDFFDLDLQDPRIKTLV